MTALRAAKRQAFAGRFAARLISVNCFPILFLTPGAGSIIIDTQLVSYNYYVSRR